MIAENFRKHPEAMALQLVLVFGRCVWHTSRPTTRVGRKLRALVAAAVKAAPKVVYPEHKPTPQWAKDLGKLVRKVGQSVKAAQIHLDFEAPRKLNPYQEMLKKWRKEHRHVFEIHGPEFFNLF